MTTRTTRSGALVAIMLVAAACGNSTEDGIERLIESETGGSVEIDLGGDDGINIQTEDGGITFDEDGNFTVVGADGEVITGDIDVDGDSINIESDDGDMSIQGDGESGDVLISSDDGDVSFSSSQDIPEQWPPEVPEPTGLAIIAGGAFDDGTNSSVTVTGTSPASPTEYIAVYGPMLEAAGFEQTSFFEAGGNVTAFFESAVWNVSVSGASDGGGSTTINVGVTPVP